jgi:hypothetical protein
MANPADPIDRTDKNPAHHTDESEGAIKKPQQTDANMAGKDLPRGSEKETHARK